MSSDYDDVYSVMQAVESDQRNNQDGRKEQEVERRSKSVLFSFLLHILSWQVSKPSR